MIKIRAVAQVSVWQHFDDDREPQLISDPNGLMYFNGLEYRDEAFSDYFSDSEDTASSPARH